MNTKTNDAQDSLYDKTQKSGSGIISSDIKTQEFMPSIMIGLGGTGKEVLLRIRRQFVERYSSLNDFPITSYLYIDTDNAPPEESGLARDRDYLINEIDFQPAEKIFNPVNPSDYIQSLNSVPHIKSWLSTSGEIGKLGTMNTGAGQIRPAARLAFFHNYDEIVQKLTLAKSRITDPKSINLVKNRYNIKNVVTEKINIYVISSVSGGTGSGMFIDFGFLLRHIFKNQAITACFLLLPKIFQGYGKERVYANGYAAMKELEYYNFKNIFTAEWKKNEEFKFQPGIYDDVYLIDGENVKNLSLSDLSSRDIYKMISDSVFHDFSNSDFANYKRGVRVNLTQYKQRFWPEDNSVDNTLFCRKYSTIGQSTVSIPADRIILACTYKLSSEVIDYYLSFAEGTQSSLDTYLMNEFLPEMGLLEHGNKHQILESLYRIDEKSTIQGKIKGFLTGLENILISGKRGNDWTSFILSEKQKFDSNFKDDTDVKRLGQFYAQIESNKTILINKLVGSRENGKTGFIEKKINSLINDTSRGVFYSIGLLRRLQFILTNEAYDYMPKMEKDIKDLQIRLSRIESDVKRIFQDLREDEARSKFNILKKSAMQGTLNKLTSVLEDYYNTLIKLSARYYALEVISAILLLIEKGEKTDTGKIKFTGLITDLNKLTGNLGVLKDYFSKKYLYFASKPENSFNYYLYSPDDIENEYYPRYIGTGKNAEDKIKSVAEGLLKELEAENIADMVNILKDSNIVTIDKKIAGFCRKQFENVRKDYDIVKMLFEKDAVRSETNLRSLLNLAFVWLKFNDIPGSFKLDESAKKLYIGLKTSGEYFSRFRSFITSVLNTEVEFKDSADSTTIIFYSEWAGFPLFYVKTVAEDMKNYYKVLSENQNVDLHITKNSFIYEDIIPLGNEERKRLNDSFKAYFLGLVFGLFKIEIEEDKFTGEKRAIYKITRQEGVTVKRTEQLGIESKLITRLFEEKGKDSMRAVLLNEAEKIKSRLSSGGLDIYLLILYEYYYEHVYTIEEIETTGKGIRHIEPYQYKVIRELARELENRLGKDYLETNTRKISELKNNPDSFSYLCGDGNKRILKLDVLLNFSPEKPAEVSDDSPVLKKLRELKKAFEEKLISEEEYNKARKKIIDN
jgi:hypothetical protein